MVMAMFLELSMFWSQTQIRNAYFYIFFYRLLSLDPTRSKEWYTVWSVFYHYILFASVPTRVSSPLGLYLRFARLKFWSRSTHLMFIGCVASSKTVCVPCCSDPKDTWAFPRLWRRYVIHIHEMYLWNINSVSPRRVHRMFKDSCTVFKIYLPRVQRFWSRTVQRLVNDCSLRCLGTIDVFCSAVFLWCSWIVQEVVQSSWWRLYTLYCVQALFTDSLRKLHKIVQKSSWSGPEVVVCTEAIFV